VPHKGLYIIYDVYFDDELGLPRANDRKVSAEAGRTYIDPQFPVAEIAEGVMELEMRLCV
jgi:hypothetical protein